MFPFVLSVLSIITTTAFSQRMLIPYKAGSLYGLSNEQGKIVVPPIYDGLNWLEEGWFETSKKLVLQDTLEISKNHFFRRNETVELTGLIHNGEVILKDETFEDYEIILGRCIIARAKTRIRSYTKEQFSRYKKREKFYSLFNASGVNLYPENFQRIQKIDTSGNSRIYKNKCRYILFGAKHYDNKHSFFVFDMDNQLISEWLIKEANNVKVTDFNLANKLINLEVTDQFYHTVSKTIDFSKGKFVLTASNKKPTPGNYDTERGASVKDDREQMITAKESSSLDDNVAVPDQEAPDNKPAPAFISYCQKINDSLFYITGNNSKKAIDLPTAATIIFQDRGSITQYGPIIYKLGEKFGLIVDGVAAATDYDSLVYFGNKFLSWKTFDNQKKCGVMEAAGSPVINFVYDSIYAGIRELVFEDKSITMNSNYQMLLKERSARYDYTKPYAYKRQPSEVVTVYKNGKWGVLNMLEQTVIDIAYELIAINGQNFMQPKMHEFIILKQNGRYGLTNLKYNRTLKKSEMHGTIRPIFTHVPGYYYPNYYNKKGYKLVGLYDEKYGFKGYGNEKGVVFFKQ